MEDWPLLGRLYGRTWQRVCAEVYRIYGRRCWLCGQDGADTVDHVIPLNKGGTNALANLRPAHGRKSTSCAGNFGRSNRKQTKQSWIASGW